MTTMLHRTEADANDDDAEWQRFMAVHAFKLQLLGVQTILTYNIKGSTHTLVKHFRHTL